MADWQPITEDAVNALDQDVDYWLWSPKLEAVERGRYYWRQGWNPHRLMIEGSGEYNALGGIWTHYAPCVKPLPPTDGVREDALRRAGAAGILPDPEVAGGVAPAPQPWRGLTKDEIDHAVGELVEYGTEFAAPLYAVVEGIERKLREHNDGVGVTRSETFPLSDADGRKT